MNKEEGGSLTDKFVHDEFTKTLRSGFYHDAIRNGMRAFLRTEFTDDELREELGELTLTEKEHDEKFPEAAAATASVLSVQQAKVQAKKNKDPLVGHVAHVTKKVDNLEKGMEVLTAEIRDQNKFLQDGYTGRGFHHNNGNRGGYGNHRNN